MVNKLVFTHQLGLNHNKTLTFLTSVEFMDNCCNQGKFISSFVEMALKYLQIPIVFQCCSYLVYCPPFPQYYVLAVKIQPCQALNTGNIKKTSK